MVPLKAGPELQRKRRPESGCRGGGAQEVLDEQTCLLCVAAASPGKLLPFEDVVISDGRATFHVRVRLPCSHIRDPGSCSGHIAASSPTSSIHLPPEPSDSTGSPSTCVSPLLRHLSVSSNLLLPAIRIAPILPLYSFFTAVYFLSKPLYLPLYLLSMCRLSPRPILRRC